MKNKNPKKTISITNEKYTNEWRIAQNIGRFNEWLNQLPDAAQVAKQKRRSVPVDVLPMIY